ncbi:MAG: hypothetical protein FD125_1092 [bacterium]|nr:MAG: hypothetical protein FD125_1092 [bacterium]
MNPPSAVRFRMSGHGIASVSGGMISGSPPGLSGSMNVMAFSF